MARNNDPRYRRIHEDIKRKISSGSILTGMAIDSETQLSQTWECSRHTVRRALLQLAEQGLLQQRPGRGWFVTNKKYQEHTDQKIICVGWNPSNQLQEITSDHGYQLKPTHIAGNKRQELFADICNDDSVVGVIAVEMREAPVEFINEIQKQGKHIVLVGLCEAHQCDVISLDFFNASIDIVQKALAKDHQDIAFIGRHLHVEIPPFKRRIEGYIHACHLNNLRIYDWVIPRDMYSSDAIHEWISDKIKQHPQVSACLLDANNTAQCLSTLHSLKKIPQELIVAGFGNGRIPYGQSLPVESFDAIYEPWDELHAIAVHRLLARLNGDTSRPIHSLMPCEFIAGATGLL